MVHYHFGVRRNDEDKMLRLEKVCGYITENYEKLQSEFEAINKFLCELEYCASAYTHMKFVGAYLKDWRASVDTTALKCIIDQLEEISEELADEFVQGVDFVNIIDHVLQKNEWGNVVVYIWKVKKILLYFNYQITRIYNASSMEKKLTILRGMLAY